MNVKLTIYIALSKQSRLNNFLPFLAFTLAHPGTNQNHPPTLGRSKASNSFLPPCQEHLRNSEFFRFLFRINKFPLSWELGLTRHSLLRINARGWGRAGWTLWVGRVFWRRLALDLNHLLSKPSICPVSSIFFTVHPPSSKG
ncbi:hypothetical protein CEXT_327991 [Caerostris extrusa]|uniref:Uncharacterized protein n=1 Tax=Caerostris extrusa TaxID=172846 RepID=A0AAV4WV87_CAEEX|nr:hypothetical protein CEXT_327991 [Caerostris extrusa]